MITPNLPIAIFFWKDCPPYLFWPYYTWIQMLSDEGERGQRCQMWGNSESWLSKASTKELSTSKLVHSSALGKDTHCDLGKEPQQGRAETGASWPRLSQSMFYPKILKGKRCEATLSQTFHYPCGLPPSKHFARVGLWLPHRCEHSGSGWRQHLGRRGQPRP